MEVFEERKCSPMLLNLQMIADSMDEELWDYTSYQAAEEPCLRGYLIYCGQEELSEDILYVVPGDLAYDFPVDRYSYITTEELPGKAAHIRKVDRNFSEMLNLVISTFHRYHAFELDLNGIITGGGDLNELCRVGSNFFHNPVYIHDDLFSIIAMSGHVEGMLEFDRNEGTGKMHIPLWLINDFKFDESYRETMSLRCAGLWGNDHFPFNMRSLFVNLWEGERYRGRLLINEIHSSLKPGQFRAAEYMANYITVLLQHMEQRQDHKYQNFEQTIIDLATGTKLDERDLRIMLKILEWAEEDTYLCIKLKPQDPGISIRSDSALNSVLASLLRCNVAFYHQKQLCILVNLQRSGLNPHEVRQILASYIRDSYMYCGISNPVNGIRLIDKGFLQTDIALNFISRIDNYSWIIFFSDCALSYIRESIAENIPTELLIHPVLHTLAEHDQRFDTQYYDTLRTYLLYERNIPLTSKKMIIHRTTLSYRLGKIHELTNLDLENENLRLYLLLSFYFMDAAHGRPL